MQRGDPGRVVMIKGALGAIVTALLVLALGKPLPDLQSALTLFVVGATGYGLSLRFYLLAQRAFGAARTGSVFAFAPFVGAVLALILGDRSGSVWTLAGASMMVVGIVLHLAERHAHEHEHEPLEHEYARSNDEAHHLHRKTPMPAGIHSHRHRHQPMTHSHPHVPDEHHVYMH